VILRVYVSIATTQRTTLLQISITLMVLAPSCSRSCDMRCCGSMSTLIEQTSNDNLEPY
jgi:hypothetical protein